MWPAVCKSVYLILQRAKVTCERDTPIEDNTGWCHWHPTDVHYRPQHVEQSGEQRHKCTCNCYEVPEFSQYVRGGGSPPYKWLVLPVLWCSVRVIVLVGQWPTWGSEWCHSRPTLTAVCCWPKQRQPRSKFGRTNTHMWCFGATQPAGVFFIIFLVHST